MLITKQFSLANKPRNEKTGLWVFDPVNDNPVYTFSLVWNRTRKYYELTKPQVEAINDIIKRTGVYKSEITAIMPTGLDGSNLAGWTFDYKNFEGGTASTISFSNGLTGDMIVNSPEQGNLLKFRKEGYTFTIYLQQLPIPSDGYPRAISWMYSDTTPRIYTAGGLEFKPSETLKIGPNTIFEADIRAIGFDGQEPSQVTYYY